MLRWLNRIALGYIALATLLALRRGTVEALSIFIALFAVYLILCAIVFVIAWLIRVARRKPVKPEVIE